jgi:hypothetical protein
MTVEKLIEVLKTQDPKSTVVLSLDFESQNLSGCKFFRNRQDQQDYTAIPESGSVYSSDDRVGDLAIEGGERKLVIFAAARTVHEWDNPPQYLTREERKTA